MAALALLCLASQASSIAHVAFVAHAACAEHGELIDSGSAAGARRAVALPGTPGPSLSAPDSPAASHSHDHCVVAATRRERVRQAASPALTLDCGCACVATRELDARYPVALALLRVAPKSSPPV